MKKLYPLLSVLFLIYWGCEEEVEKSTGGVKPIPSRINQFMTGYTPPPPPQGEMVDGKMEGLWTFYLINGDIRTHGEMVDGKKEGLWTSYRESGIGGESNYKDGKLHGLTTIYYPPLIGTWFGGMKSREIMYNHDEQIENQRYDRFGFRREEKEWVKKYQEDGKRMGNKWYDNGEKMSQGNLKDGEKDGLSTYWYENGQKKFEETWKDGEVVELIGKWNEDGSVKE